MGTESRAVQVFLAALDDGRVTPEEMGRLIRAVRDDHVANERLVVIANRIMEAGG